MQHYAHQKQQSILHFSSLFSYNYQLNLNSYVTILQFYSISFIHSLKFRFIHLFLMFSFQRILCFFHLLWSHQWNMMAFNQLNSHCSGRYILSNMFCSFRLRCMFGSLGSRGLVRPCLARKDHLKLNKLHPRGCSLLGNLNIYQCWCRKSYKNHLFVDICGSNRNNICSCIRYIFPQYQIYCRMDLPSPKAFDFLLVMKNNRLIKRSAQALLNYFSCVYGENNLFTNIIIKLRYFSFITNIETVFLDWNLNILANE